MTPPLQLDTSRDFNEAIRQRRQDDAIEYERLMRELGYTPDEAEVRKMAFMQQRRVESTQLRMLELDAEEAAIEASVQELLNESGTNEALIYEQQQLQLHAARLSYVQHRFADDHCAAQDFMAEIQTEYEQLGHQSDNESAADTESSSPEDDYEQDDADEANDNIENRTFEIPNAINRTYEIPNATNRTFEIANNNMDRTFGIPNAVNRTYQIAAEVYEDSAAEFYVNELTPDQSDNEEADDDDDGTPATNNRTYLVSNENNRTFQIPNGRNRTYQIAADVYEDSAAEYYGNELTLSESEQQDDSAADNLNQTPNLNRSFYGLPQTPIDNPRQAAVDYLIEIDEFRRRSRFPETPNLQTPPIAQSSPQRRDETAIALVDEIPLRPDPVQLHILQTPQGAFNARPQRDDMQTPVLLVAIDDDNDVEEAPVPLSPQVYMPEESVPHVAVDASRRVPFEPSRLVDGNCDELQLIAYAAGWQSGWMAGNRVHDVQNLEDRANVTRD